eukprot:3476858-Pyramimonas_sp.AAC.1
MPRFLIRASRKLRLSDPTGAMGYIAQKPHVVGDEIVNVGLVNYQMHGCRLARFYQTFHVRNRSGVSYKLSHMY